MRNVFAIRKEERLIALLAVVLFAALNGLMIYKYYGLFTRGGNLGYWTLFHDHFCVSGFDVLGYLTVSRWKVYYSLYRHPLLSLLLYPLYALNHWLMGIYGFNFAVYIVGALMLASAVYSFLFMHRIFRERIGLGRSDALLLTLLTFSFAYIMLSCMVPDHFGLSLLLLTLTLYLGTHPCPPEGRECHPDGAPSLREGRGGFLPPFGRVGVGILFLLTTGVTTTNGVKVALAAWIANGRKVFHWRYMLVAFVLPLLILASAYAWQYNEFVVPERIAQDINLQLRKDKDKKFAEKIEKHNAWKARQNGKPLIDNPLFEWTSTTVPRWQSCVENLLGESVMLHQDYLLRDMNVDRPVVVPYRWAAQYVFVALLVVLFVWGAWCGRRERLMQICLSWLAFDLLLHVVLAFGLTEVYIMGAHWLFIIPIALAYLLKNQTGRQPLLRVLLWAMTAGLWAYNGWLVAGYMLHRMYW